MIDKDPIKNKSFVPYIYISKEQKLEIIKKYYGSLDNSRRPTMPVRQLADEFCLPVKKISNILYYYNKNGHVEDSRTLIHREACKTECLSIKQEEKGLTTFSKELKQMVIMEYLGGIDINAKPIKTMHEVAKILGIKAR